MVIECSDSDHKRKSIVLFKFNKHGDDDAVKYVEKARDAISKIPSAYITSN